jgi:hypothetical protein
MKICRPFRFLFGFTGFLLSLGLPPPLYSEDFYLKNGQILQGKMTGEEDAFYIVDIPSVGSIHLDKIKVLKIEKNKISASPKDIFQDKVEKAQTKEDFLNAAEYGLNCGMHSEALVLLKKTWVMDGKKDSALKERIDKMQNQKIFEQLNKSKLLSDSGQFRQAVDILNKTLVSYPDPSRKEEIKTLRRALYKQVLSEEECISFLEKGMNFFPLYSIGPSKEKASSSPSSPEDKVNVTFDLFKQQEKKMDPVFSSIVFSFYSLFQLKDYIEKNQFHAFSGQAVHLKAELDSKRADSREFNKLCAENNKIYRGKTLCRQFNQMQTEVMSQLKGLKSRLLREKEIWTQKGYEKILGEWLKGDEIKKAKGYLYYLGEWLDPKAPDFEKTRLALDEKQEKLKTPSLPLPKLPVPPVHGLAKKEEKQGSSTEDDILSRTPKKLVEQVKETLKEDAKNKMNQELEKMKKTSVDLAREISTEGEKTRGVPIPLGIAIVVGLVLVLKFARKKR